MNFGYNNLPYGWCAPNEEGYAETPEDAWEDIKRLQREYENLTEIFIVDNLGEIEESDDITKILDGMKKYESQLEDLRGEMEDAEEVIRHQPDPDVGWDDPDIGGW